MKDHVYKIIEVVGSSDKSVDEAIKTAVSTANQSIRNMGWFEVIQTRGHIEGGKVAQYQVTLKIGFRLDD